MNKIDKFKAELNRVFDDDLHTKQWHNYVDYAIIGLIILSTVEVFLSTYDGIVEKYGKWLHFVDYFTTFVWWYNKWRNDGIFTCNELLRNHRRV